MDVVSYLLGKNASGGGGGGGTDKIYPYSLSIQNYLGDSINVDAIDTSRIETTSNMFNSCLNITELDLSKWDMTNALYTNQMFYGCSKLEKVTLNNTCFANTKNFLYGFRDCPKLVEITGIETMNTSKCTTFEGLFQNDVLLETIPVIDMSGLTGGSGLSYIYTNCPKLTDESLDNVLKSFMTITSAFTATKSLYNAGFRRNQYPVARIQALPSYNDFIAAGCSIGY